MKKTAIIILANGFEEIEAVAPIDLLRRASIDVTVVGLNSLEITGSHSISIKADRIFENMDFLPDALILPGGPGHKNLLNSEAVDKFIQEMYSQNRLCAAICAAPSVLGKAGILDNKKATCFPGFEDKLGKAIFINQPVVSDGNVITSRGAGTALLFSLEIIGYLIDKKTADRVAAEIVFK